MTRAVRNALAEVIRAALPPAAGGTLDALARALAAEHPVEMSRVDAARLRPLVVTVSSSGGVARAALAPTLAAVRAEARERVRRGLAARRRLQRRRGGAGDGGPGDLAVTLRRAAALFDAGLYFEVHEELEVPWRHATGDTRHALQGLVQVAVALHHAEAGNVPSMHRLLDTARAKLAPYVPVWHGVALASLLQDVAAYEAAVRRRQAPRRPRLVVA